MPPILQLIKEVLPKSIKIHRVIVWKSPDDLCWYTLQTKNRYSLGFGIWRDIKPMYQTSYENALNLLSTPNN